MALNFADVATKKIEDLERPKLPPTGMYLWVITKTPIQATLTGDKWDTLDFPIKVVAPTSDVDTSSYEGDITKYQTRHRFMFNKEDKEEFTKGVDRVRRFLEDHVKCATPEMSLNEAIAASVNCQIMAEIKWVQDKIDAEVFHANIGKTAPADA